VNPTALVSETQPKAAALAALAVDGLTSPHSKRAYATALTDFLKWCGSEPQASFTKATVQKYKAKLESAGLSTSSINVRMSAIRRLATEAADNGLVSPELAAGISRVKGAKRSGVRTGNWLTVAQAEHLINAPNVSILKGKRDRALLALMIGCGLRRAEIARLDFEHIQQREGRWAIVRGSIYAVASLATMAGLGLIRSWWALLALPVAMLIGYAFAGAGLAATTHGLPGPAGPLEGWHVPHAQGAGVVLLVHGDRACKAELLPEARACQACRLDRLLMRRPPFPTGQTRFAHTAPPKTYVTRPILFGRLAERTEGEGPNRAHER